MIGWEFKIGALLLDLSGCWSNWCLVMDLFRILGVVCNFPGSYGSIFVGFTFLVFNCNSIQLNSIVPILLLSDEAYMPFNYMREQMKCW